MFNFTSVKAALEAVKFGEAKAGDTGNVAGRPAVVVSLDGIETIQFLGETHTVGTQRPADGRTFHRSAYGRSVEEA